jgi:hypothetical protein
MIASLLLLLALGVAGAEDGAPAGPPTAAPPLRVTGFVGRADGACDDASAARRGECVDVVDFFPFERAFVGGPPDAAERAVLRDLGPLYAWVWEDLAVRWAKADVEATLKADGYVALPSVREAWARGHDDRRSYALPRPELWLGDGGWADVDGASTDPRDLGVFFPHVRYAGPDGQAVPVETTLLRGRFARRLGAGGRLVDVDLMDAHPDASAPFFEQMFPYAASSLADSGLDDVYGVADRVPLVEFRWPQLATDDEADAAVREAAFRAILVDHDPAALRDAVGEHFERFLRVVFVQTTQYAMEDFTTNQVRLLAALTAMATPPEGLAAQTGLARDLVAASRHETDNAAEVLEKASADRSSVPVGVHLRYQELPGAVVAPWVARLIHRDDVRPDLVQRVEADVRAEIGGRLRPQASPLRSLEPGDRRTWMAAAVLPGEDWNEIDGLLLRRAFGRILEAMPGDERARIESWMLADQARFAIADTFDPSALATPREVAKAAAEAWQGTLAAHGYASRQVPQGLGAIDPTAVCTTQDGLAALDEPSFGAATVDQLVAGPPGADAERILAAARDTLPFVHLDDAHQLPEVARLVELGDGRVLYRLRWHVWRGWHLFWSATPFDGKRDRLVLRTGAICDDTVLAAADLVPTIVRAGLLAGNHRPSTPERPAEADVAKRKLKVPVKGSAEDQLEGAEDKVRGAVDAAKKQLDAAKKALEDPLGTLSQAKLPAFGEKAFEIVQEALRPEARYLADLVHAPLRRLGAKGLALFVFDATSPGPKLALGDVVPRTPYVRDQERLRARELGERPDRDDAFVRTAGWLWYFQPSRELPVEVAPAYAPKDSVTAGDRLPRWSRRRTVAFSLDFGVAAFPFHRSVFRPDADTAPPTFGGLQQGYLQTEGGGLDVEGLATWWGLDRPRIALDAGVEARLDFRAAGRSVFYDGNEQPAGELSFPWALRFQAGALIGFRHEPVPAPLSRRGTEAAVWGAPRSDGRSIVARMQWGMRSGLLFGPGYNGAEASALLEVWAGWSTRGRRGVPSTFNPYRPSFLIGPFARASYGFPVSQANDPGRFLVLQDSWTVYLGLRSHLRVSKSIAPPKGGK